MPEAPKQLLDMRVGISISDVPLEDLESRGLSMDHLNHAFLELARHLLARGATLVYGGDYRLRGFTLQLIDLVRTYDLEKRPAASRIVNYLAQPLYDGMSAADRSLYLDAATLVRVPAPPALKDKGITPEADKTLYAACCFTEMRNEMNKNTDARVFLGGRVDGFASKFPGILEEGCLAIAAQRPVFLLGGFGGCTEVMTRVVKSGEVVREFTTEYQKQKTKGYTELLKNYEEKLGEKVNYDESLRLLQGVNRDGQIDLHNGLPREKNLLLFETDDVDLAISYVLEGLIEVWKPRLPPASA